jgi:hypothetical protein
MAYDRECQRIDEQRAYIERQRERNRTYRERNRKRIFKERRNFRECNPEYVREQQRRSYERDRERRAQDQRAYRERNGDYVAKRNRRRWLHLKEIPAPRNGTRWTPAEDAIVTRDDISHIEMCYMTGRSYGAVGSRRQALRDRRAEATRRHQRRLRLKEIPVPRNGTRWTPAEDAIVTRDDISIVEMCYMTGRSYGAVNTRRWKVMPKPTERQDK